MRRRILVADDSSTIQKVIKIAFSRYTIDVVDAASFIEALSAIGNGRPDVLILDASLPGAQGPKDFAKLSAEAGSIPVLLLVGTYETIDEAQFRAAGLGHFLRKPFDSADLVQQVEQILGQPLVSHDGGTGRPSSPAAVPLVTPPSFATTAAARQVARGVAPGGQRSYPMPPLPDEGLAGQQPEQRLVPPPPPPPAARMARSRPPESIPSGIAQGADELRGLAPDELTSIKSIPFDIDGMPNLFEPRPDDLRQASATPTLPSEVKERSSLRGARIDRFDVDPQALIAEAEDDESQVAPPPDPRYPPPIPEIADERRRGRRAFAGGSLAAEQEVEDNSYANLDLNPDIRPNTPLASSGLADHVVDTSGHDQLPAWVREAVESYCERHFKSLAREIIAAELRRLADEKARHLVDP